MGVHLLHYLQNSVETATVHEFEDQVHYTLVIVGTKKGYLKFYMLLDLNCRHKRELMVLVDLHVSLNCKASKKEHKAQVGSKVA